MYDKAIKAIHEVHKQKKSLEQTLEDLQGLEGEIEILIDAVKGDIENQNRNR